MPRGPAGDYGDYESLPTTAAAEAITTSLGGTDPTLATHGAAYIWISDATGAQLAGASVALDVAATGPFYFAPDGTPDTSLTATSTAGIALFLDVPPGTHAVTVTHASMTCDVPTYVWPGTGSALTFPVVAGLIASPGVGCH